MAEPRSRPRWDDTTDEGRRPLPPLDAAQDALYEAALRDARALVLSRRDRRPHPAEDILDYLCLHDPFGRIGRGGLSPTDALAMFFVGRMSVLGDLPDMTEREIERLSYHQCTEDETDG